MVINSRSGKSKEFQSGAPIRTLNTGCRQTARGDRMKRGHTGKNRYDKLKRGLLSL